MLPGLSRYFVWWPSFDKFASVALLGNAQDHMLYFSRFYDYWYCVKVVCKWPIFLLDLRVIL
jgi:hypothetical protein